MTATETRQPLRVAAGEQRQAGADTERQQAEEWLRESETRYRNLVENTMDWIWEMGLDGTHTYSNHRLETILGYSADEFAKLTRDEWMHREDVDEFNQRLPTLIAEKKGWQGWVLRFRHKNGGYRCLESNAHPILDAAGTMCGFRGVDRDVTERTQLEREVLAVVEGERRRIGRDLHDGLGQELTGISFGLQLLCRKLGDEHSPHVEALEHLTAMAQKAIAETQRVVRLLSPEFSTELGLCTALRALAEEVNRHSEVNCHVQCSVDQEFHDDETATHVYRIAQESINNALKHGNARNIELRYGRDGDSFFLEVLDDGTGIPAKERRAEGMGLKSMRYRARLLRGRLEVGLRTQGGTRVLCSCPSRSR